MNQTMNDLLTRRSVRQFSADTIDETVFRQLIQAADAAPSAHGKKPWRFAEIASPEVRQAIVARLPWFKPALGAPRLVLVLGSPEDCVQSEYWMVDCAAATQNLLIAARGQGIGSLWMGISPVAGNVALVSQCLDIPHGLVPFALVALGRPADPGAFAASHGSVANRCTLVSVPPRG